MLLVNRNPFQTENEREGWKNVFLKTERYIAHNLAMPFPRAAPHVNASTLQAMYSHINLPSFARLGALGARMNQPMASNHDDTHSPRNNNTTTAVLYCLNCICSRDRDATARNIRALCSRRMFAEASQTCPPPALSILVPW